MLAVLLAWRFLRHPDRNTETVRASIGWTALLLGAAGLIHMAKGTPRPSDGEHAMRPAGGFVGYEMSGPLARAVTPWATALLLALLALYGLLLISGTPVHRIPERFAELREMFGHARPHAGLTMTPRDRRGLRGRHRPYGAPGARPARPADQAPPGHRGGRAHQALRLAAVEPDMKRAGKLAPGASRPDASDGLVEALGFGGPRGHRPVPSSSPHDARARAR